MNLLHTFHSPLGPISLGWSSKGLTTLFLGLRETAEDGVPPSWVINASDRICHILAGAPWDLQTLPVDLTGQPPFRRRVLEALHNTRPGERLTYGDLAHLVGAPGAAQAVGQAVKRNPLPIVIPCHRVVGSNGPGGFSFGKGLETKQQLLDLEDRHTGIHGALPF